MAIEATHSRRVAATPAQKRFFVVCAATNLTFDIRNISILSLKHVTAAVELLLFLNLKYYLKYIKQGFNVLKGLKISDIK